MDGMGHTTCINVESILFSFREALALAWVRDKRGSDCFVRFRGGAKGGTVWLPPLDWYHRGDFSPYRMEWRILLYKLVVTVGNGCCCFLKISIRLLRERVTCEMCESGVEGCWSSI